MGMESTSKTNNICSDQSEYLPVFKFIRKFQWFKSASFISWNNSLYLKLVEHNWLFKLKENSNTPQKPKKNDPNQKLPNFFLKRRFATWY